jgi:transglutaminase-like putative cysteine protease
MLLHVRHETLYKYTPAVENAQHTVHLRPADSAFQTVLKHALHITPQPVQQRKAIDGFGNSKLFFSLQTSHDELQVIADSVVQTLARPSDDTSTSDLAWDHVREAFRYRSGAAYNSAWEFVFASPFVPRHEDFSDFAKFSFTPGRPLLEAVHELMTRIHSAMVYDGESTEVDTPALVALEQRKGVCQDFAHIMVACCRSMGLPARYVSGYMLTQPPPGQPRLIGSDASHAWASVYCPNTQDEKSAAATGRWFDFDPTNNRAPGEDYVTLATGRDFLDVSPMRGVIRGGAKHTLDVAVTVTPLPSTPESI